MSDQAVRRPKAGDPNRLNISLFLLSDTRNVAVKSVKMLKYLSTEES